MLPLAAAMFYSIFMILKYLHSNVIQRVNWHWREAHGFQVHCTVMVCLPRGRSLSSRQGPCYSLALTVHGCMEPLQSVKACLRSHLLTDDGITSFVLCSLLSFLFPAVLRTADTTPFKKEYSSASKKEGCYPRTILNLSNLLKIKLNL